MATIKLEVLADTAKVREAMDRLVADARNRPITVPVQAGGGTSAVGGTGAIQPNQATTAQLRDPIQAGQPGQLPPLLRDFYLAGNDPSISAFVRGQQGGGGGGQGGAPAGMFSRFNRFGSRLGIGDMLGIGGVASGVGNVLSANRAYLLDQALAGSDQRDQLEATLKQRERIASSFGFVSRIGAFLQDPTGSGEAAIRLGLSESDARDRQTAGLQRGQQFRAGLQDERTISATHDPHQRRLRELDIEHRKRLEQITEESRKESKENEDVVRERRANLESQVYDRAQGNLPTFHTMATHEAEMERLRRGDTADMANLEAAQNQRVNARAGQNRSAADEIYDLNRREIVRGRTFQVAGDALAAGGDIAVANLAANNRPRDAQRLALQNSIQAAIFKSIGDRESAMTQAGIGVAGAARLRAFDVETANQVGEDQAARAGVLADSEGRVASIRAGLARRPLEARELDIRLRGQRRLREVSNDEALYNQISEEIEAEIQQTRQGVGDERELREMALAGRGRVIDAQGAGGRTSPMMARAVAIREEANLEAERLRREDPEGNKKAIGLIFENALGEGQALEKAFINSFKATGFDPSRTDIGGGNNDKDTLDVLKDIRDIMSKIESKDTNAVGP